MRICLIGEHSGTRDEAMRNQSFHMAQELSKGHQVLALEVRDFYRRRFWKEMASFHPDIVHYLHGPSIVSLIIMKAISLRHRKARTVVSAPHPHLPSLTRRLIPLLRPSLVLVLSEKTQAMFSKHGCKTAFLSLGVDTEKFSPVSIQRKRELRERHGIDQNTIVLLHVGSIKEKRNVLSLRELQGGDNQVLVVGAASTGIEEAVLHGLREHGCLVWTGYVDNLEEVYALSDCYIFPTTDETACIELPLTVLEAMSCNLPVVATRFGALPRMFEEANGLAYLDSDMGLSRTLQGLMRNGLEVHTREMVEPYSWDRVASELTERYQEIIKG
jgi:glycosyltransferase involved in cell wall biosynthesis